jgi:small-conductance mechanosensitive channel
MRCIPLITILAAALALASPIQASAQSLAAHQADNAAKSQPAPAAAPKPSTIIPGSPLAALTGATPSDSDENEPSPFGTNALGLSVTELISREASGTLLDFIGAIRKSTALTPVRQWLQSFPGDGNRKQHAREIAEGLAAIVLPALIVDALLRFALARPRAMLVRRAAHIPDTDSRESAGPEDDAFAAAEGSAAENRAGRRDSIMAWFRRLLLAVLHLLLCLLPVVGFGVAVGFLLGFGFVTSRDARLSIFGVSNAYLFCRITLEILRFLAAPWTPPLRMIRMPNSRAFWLNRWVRILLATGGVGYGIVSISEILGLPKPGAMAVNRLLALAIHIELAIMIWRGRKVVGGWIKGGPAAQAGPLAGPRRRLGQGWQYLALFYVLALWVAWAGGVPHAFTVLLRVVVCFMAAMILGRLAWGGSAHLLERLFPDPTGRDLRHPNLLSRARAYNPLLKTLMRVVIAVAMVAIILLGWGINLLPWLMKDKISRILIPALISILIIIAVALLIWELANAWLDLRVDRLTAAGKTRQALRLRTLAPILKATFGTTIGLLAGLICLSRIGVNAAPLLAGAGVLGIAIGFGSQKLVQDIITGLFLLLEDTMQVGDVVTLAGMSGTVERLSVRTIRLRGGDGSVNIIPFSAVTTVTNQTRDFGLAQISVGVGYNENIDYVCAVLSDIARTMRKEATWGPMMRDDLQINGLDELGATALVITGQIRTGPGQHWAVRREFSRRMIQRFAEERIDIPYTAGASTVMVEPAALNAPEAPPMPDENAEPAAALDDANAKPA